MGSPVPHYRTFFFFPVSSMNLWNSVLYNREFPPYHTRSLLSSTFIQSSCTVGQKQRSSLFPSPLLSFISEFHCRCFDPFPPRSSRKTRLAMDR
uniref:Uncharacterized protein n=1 Tax=Pristionchus pacificus TaxID=54126 RepID=A0A2A6BG67_PRIPA